MKSLILLRPEPGLTRSRERAEALGLVVIEAPLFAIEAVAWALPEGDFDALLLTSANALSATGELPNSLRSLPVHAVGECTASAARKAGLEVVTVGDGGVRDLLATLPDQRLLHLAGEQFIDHDDPRVTPVIVYRAVERGELPGSIEGAVIAVHSPRAGRRLAALATSRDATICAISAAAAAACGEGWDKVAVAPQPSDVALLALAARLCQDSPR